MSKKSNTLERLGVYFSNFMFTAGDNFPRAVEWNKRQPEPLDEIEVRTETHRIAKDTAITIVNELDYRDLLDIRLALNEAMSKQEAIRTEFLIDHPDTENYRGFQRKEGRNFSTFTDYKGMVKLLTERGVQRKDLYTVKELGVPAIRKILAQQDDVKELTKKFIKTTKGDGSFEYVGEDIE